MKRLLSIPVAFAVTYFVVDLWLEKVAYTGKRA